MELRRHGFWASLYRDCRIIWVAFAHNKPQPRFFETDLCTFVRRIFVWAPLAILMNLVVAVFMLATVGNFLWMLFLNAATVGAIILVVLVIVALIATLFGTLWFGELATETAIKNSETVQLAAEYIVAKKAAVCPLITMKEDAPDAAA